MTNHHGELNRHGKGQRSMAAPPPCTYFIINDGYVGGSGQGYGCDPPDVFAQLCSHFQPTVSGQGPEDGINQIPLVKEERRPRFISPSNNMTQVFTAMSRPRPRATPLLALPWVAGPTCT